MHVHVVMAAFGCAVQCKRYVKSHWTGYNLKMLDDGFLVMLSVASKAV